MENAEHPEDLSPQGSEGGHPEAASGDAVILEMALRKEEYSVKLYQALLEFVSREDSRALLRTLIAEEQRHVALLREARVTGDYGKIGASEEDRSLELADYLVREDLKRSADPQTIMKMAIRREEESEEFYLSRLNLLRDTRLQDLYGRLAREETGHRGKLLANYDDLIVMHLA